jgi:crossover junction endodeoxyribonuclease RuvC
MSVGQASGLALALAAEAGCEVAEYTANEVKSTITGYGAASKQQVQRMVQAQLSLAALPSPPDAADALALALTHATLGPRRARLAVAR